MEPSVMCVSMCVCVCVCARLAGVFDRNIGRHHASSVISKRKKWSSQKNKIVMECYLLSEPNVRGYKKRMLSLWLNQGIIWVSEQGLGDQKNTIRRNS